MDTMRLKDGRTLAFDDYGDPNGTPVIFSHGFSDSRIIRHPDDALSASLGVRVIAADQPGVGGSSPLKNRRIVDWGPDMAQLADHLGLGEFNVAGHSGGGPHALSIAAHLPERVRKVALASPVAPFDAPGMTRLLRVKDLKQLAMIRRLRPLVRWAERADAKRALKDIPAHVESVSELLPHDADTFLRDPTQRAMFEENFRQGYRQVEEGVFEMTMALWGWGFELADVKQPVDVFYGDADDIISPEMPKKVTEALPRGKGHVWPGAGHYGFVDRDRWIQFLGAVAPV